MPASSAICRMFTVAKLWRANSRTAAERTRSRVAARIASYCSGLRGIEPSTPQFLNEHVFILSGARLAARPGA
ncbi:hypothetical protein GCM10009642_52130 [Nocardiopsis metallicus]